MLAGILGVAILFLIGIIIMVVFFLLNLQNTLKEVSPNNRQVPPANVWLMFIPLFNYIYPFILYPKISESLRLEFEDRGIDDGGDYGKGLGIAFAIATIVVAVLNQAGSLAAIGGVLGLGQLTLLIVFWVKMAGYKNTLKNSPQGNGNIGRRDDLLD